tara:strand:- start:639 stop:803 length:165 start_codon:yes stop_codon:yes gene_type:complete
MPFVLCVKRILAVSTHTEGGLIQISGQKEIVLSGISGRKKSDQARRWGWSLLQQ